MGCLPRNRRSRLHKRTMSAIMSLIKRGKAVKISLISWTKPASKPFILASAINKHKTLQKISFHIAFPGIPFWFPPSREPKDSACLTLAAVRSKLRHQNKRVSTNYLAPGLCNDAHAPACRPLGFLCKSEHQVEILHTVCSCVDHGAGACKLVEGCRIVGFVIRP